MKEVSFGHASSQRRHVLCNMLLARSPAVPYYNQGFLRYWCLAYNPPASTWHNTHKRLEDTPIVLYGVEDTAFDFFP